MKPNYTLHDDLYLQARQAGWQGWGGNQRLEEAVLVTRFFALENMPTQGQLLELGCGEGHHCRAFAEKGFTVTGLDISPTAIAWAQEKAEQTGIPGDFRVADLTQTRWAQSERYAVIIDGNCLHCIIGEDRLKLLKQVYQALEPGGIFFVSSLCAQVTTSYTTLREGLPYRHIAAPQDLLAELTQAGFTLLHSQIYPRSETNHITVHAQKSDSLSFLNPVFA